MWVDEETVSVRISPYSPGGKVSAPLVTVSSLEELKHVPGEGMVVLLKGEIAREQLLPENFPFLDLPEHREIIDLLESRGFKAVKCATSYHPEMAWYPEKFCRILKEKCTPGIVHSIVIWTKFPGAILKKPYREVLAILISSMCI